MNINFYYFPYSGLFNAITSLLLGSFVIFKNFKSSTNKRFAFFSFSVAWWAINYFIWLSSKSSGQALFFIRTAMVGAILIPAAYSYFITSFLGRRRNVVDVFNFIVGTLFVCFSFSPLFIQQVEPRLFFPFWPVPGYLFNLMLLYFIFHVVYVIIVLWKAMQEAQGLKKIQIKYVFFGTIIGYAGGCTNYFLWYNIPVPPYLNILVSGFIFCVAYAIVKHQLLDIEIIIKKTLVFAGLFITSYAIFASFAYLGSVVFENVVQSKWIALVPSVFIIVLTLRPLESFLRNITDKYLFQKKYDYRKLLRTFSEEVLTVLDLEMLVNLTVNKLVEIMKLNNASILLLGDEEIGTRIVASAGNVESEYKLNGNEDLVAYMQKQGGYVLREEVSQEEATVSNLRNKMNIMRANLMIPLIHQKDMVGVLTLGKKKSDEGFSQDDIDILVPLAKTLSIAISNAQLFEQLSEAQAQAAQGEKMAVIGTLSAGINHEICNPLGIARGQCEMFLLNLQEGIYKDKSLEELLEKAQEIMHKVINETDRATVITRKLSSFAKPAKGELKNNVDIKEELEKVVSLVEHDLNLDNILIEKHLQKDIPYIAADSKQIQEIFFNVIRNGAQSIEGAGKVIIRVSSDSKKVYVEIEDTGMGIDGKNLKQIFNPFFTTKEPGEGTGLGLFIVKQIVERNNGSISVTSEPDKGTVFRLVFSVSESESVEEVSSIDGEKVK